ncbi:hypothetical protein Efla_000535 [Eimeria flavescens]
MAVLVKDAISPASPASLADAVHTGPLRRSSAMTQGSEPTDARLSSTRSRALSSLLSMNTGAAVTPFGMASARGPWALFCYKVRASRLSRALLIMAVLLDSIGVVLEASSTVAPSVMWAYKLPVCMGFICVLVTGAVSRGLWSTREAYLRSWAGWLDSLVLLNVLADVLFHTGVVAGWWSYSAVTLGVLAVLRNLRAWIVLRICRTFRSAISKLARSASDLVAVSILVMVFSVLVLIVLLHFYGFASWYRCYPDLPLPEEVQASETCSVDSFFWDIDETQFRFCSSRRSPCKDGTSCRNLFLHSVTSACSAEERRALQDRAWYELQKNEEASFGVLGLQTLGAAALTLLQGFTLEGWAITMERHVDADHRSNGLIAYVVFPSVVIIGGMLLMNLAIAVLWEGFDASTTEQTTRPSIVKESEWRVYQLLGADWINYLMVQVGENWEAVNARSRGEPAVQNNAETHVIGGVKRKLVNHLSALQKRIDKATEMNFPEVRSKLRLFSRRVKNVAFHIATHRFTSPIMLIVVVADLICVLVKSGTGSGSDFTLEYIVSTTIFAVEAIVLVLAFGRRGMKDLFIRLDLLTASLGVIDGILELSICSELTGCREALLEADGPGGTVIVILSMLRPLRIFKVVKYFSALRMTAEMLCALHNSLLRYIALVFYCCGVMTQLGVLLFFDPKYSSLHAKQAELSVTKYFNFESFGNALMLLLTIMTGEGWDLVFKEFAQVYGGDSDKYDFDASRLSGILLSSSFRVSAITTFLYLALLFLNCLLFNFYGAILIGNFIRTQKALTVKYTSKFIVTCRIAGIAMPAEDALQGQHAQALYALVDMTTDDQRDELIKAILFGSEHGKPAKALGEVARKTSLALDIWKTVARKSSRIGTRGSSGSIVGLEDRKSSRRSSMIPLQTGHSPASKIMNDTDFDRAVTEQGLHPAKQGTKNVGARSQRIRKASCEMAKNTAKQRLHQGGKLLGSWPSLEDLDVNSSEGGTKAAVQFAASEQSLLLSGQSAKPFPVKRGDRPDEELQFKELCSMFWRAIKDVFRQVLVALGAAAHAALARITPADPDSPALQMAYLSQLVSDSRDVSKKRRPGLRQHVEKQPAGIPGIRALSDMEAHSRSHASFTLRKRSRKKAVQQAGKVTNLPSWMRSITLRFKTVCAHLQNVCGISGLGWPQLVLQSISLIELVAECSLKKDRSSWQIFGYLELGIQAALTAELTFRFARSYGCKAPFFTTRSNCWDVLIQVAAWCLLAVPLSTSGRMLGSLTLEDLSYRAAKCTRVLRCLWLLRLWKGTGTHRLALALQVASKRILNLGIIFVLLVAFFAADFRYLLESAAGAPPAVPLPYANLTSLSESFLSVFILTTSEGWPRVLTDFLDHDARHRPLTIILCMLVVALLSVFVLNLFVGVIVDVLDREQANMDYNGGARSATVLRWNEVQRAIFSSSTGSEMTERRGGLVRSEKTGDSDCLSHVLTSKQLDVAVAIISLASCLSMLIAGAWAETDIRWVFPSYQLWIFWANAAVIVGYAIGQCFRVSTLKKGIFQKTTYILDLAVAACSVGALIYALVTSLHTPFPAEPLWPVAFRMIQVAYVVCQRLPVMRVITITMLNVVGALGRVMLLLCGIILFYALLGTCLFFDAPINPKLHSNFASLFDSMLLLMSCCTGENWHAIMLQAREFYFQKGYPSLGRLIVIYAVSFVAVAFLLLMNVFMSTVLKGYVDTKRNQSLWKVAQQHQDLLSKWRLREMKLSWLPIHVAVQVLTDIAPPVGFRNQYVELGPRRMDAILAVLSHYDLPVHNNCVHIRDVVLATTCRACEAHAQRNETIVFLDPAQQQQKVELNPRLVNAWMNRFSDIAGVIPKFNILQYLAALHIQAFWRAYKLLQRNSTSDQLLYMHHLLFLLETSAPICAKKASRPENRRSTVRRKRGTKRGGSFAHRTTALARLGTFGRSSRAPQQTREKLKSLFRPVDRELVPVTQQRLCTGTTGGSGQHRRSPFLDEQLQQHSQKQRQRSLQRNAASECIVEVLATADPTVATICNAEYEQADSSGQQNYGTTETLTKQPSEAGNAWNLFATNSDEGTGDQNVTSDVADVVGSSAVARRLSAGSYTCTRFSVVEPLITQSSLSDSVPEQVITARAHPKIPGSPARSSLRKPEHRFMPPTRRRSLLMVPTKDQNKRNSSPGSDLFDARFSPSYPPRRRGQSVQFTGVERLELQQLLAPAEIRNEAGDLCEASKKSSEHPPPPFS